MSTWHCARVRLIPRRPIPHQETAAFLLFEPSPQPNRPRSVTTPVDFLFLWKRLISLHHAPVSLFYMCSSCYCFSAFFWFLHLTHLPRLHHRSYRPSPELLLDPFDADQACFCVSTPHWKSFSFIFIPFYEKKIFQAKPRTCDMQMSREHRSYPYLQVCVPFKWSHVCLTFPSLTALTRFIIFH